MHTVTLTKDTPFFPHTNQYLSMKGHNTIRFFNIEMSGPNDMFYLFHIGKDTYNKPISSKMPIFFVQEHLDNGYMLTLEDIELNETEEFSFRLGIVYTQLRFDFELLYVNPE